MTDAQIRRHQRTGLVVVGLSVVYLAAIRVAFLMWGTP